MFGMMDWKRLLLSCDLLQIVHRIHKVIVGMNLDCLYMSVYLLLPEFTGLFRFSDQPVFPILPFGELGLWRYNYMLIFHRYLHVQSWHIYYSPCMPCKTDLDCPLADRNPDRTLVDYRTRDSYIHSSNISAHQISDYRIGTFLTVENISPRVRDQFRVLGHVGNGQEVQCYQSFCPPKHWM